jgi:hypothetical protein
MDAFAGFPFGVHFNGSCLMRKEKMNKKPINA